MTDARYLPSPRFKSRPLTAKQVQLVELLAAGLIGKEIAPILGVNYDTVWRRLRYLRVKLDALNDVHLVAKCLRTGVIK